MTISRLSRDEIAANLTALSALLEDCVEGGASIGFLWPMSLGEADAYWRSCLTPVTDGSKLLLVARDDAGGIIGTVQLVLAERANSRHRAEVSKLMVLPSARRHGTCRALMQAPEDEARRLVRTTLVLDTFLDGGAETSTAPSAGPRPAASPNALPGPTARWARRCTTTSCCRDA